MLKYTVASRSGSIKKLQGKLWKVENEFIWWIDYQKRENCVVVEKWFVTDLWSIPRLLYALFPPHEYLAYILHDYLYTMRSMENMAGRQIAISRKQADVILYDALIAEWCPHHKAMMIYIGVRIGGWVSWHNNLR